MKKTIKTSRGMREAIRKLSWTPEQKNEDFFKQVFKVEPGSEHTIITVEDGELVTRKVIAK